VEFEWDPDKAERNKRKHKIDFEMAIKVFLDPHYVEYEQDDDEDDLRYNVIGLVEGRMLHVTYTMRGEACRVISARLAERHEKRRYHES
jgi:uncharacterized DUF497 family protein